MHSLLNSAALYRLKKTENQQTLKCIKSLLIVKLLQRFIFFKSIACVQKYFQLHFKADQGHFYVLKESQRENTYINSVLAKLYLPNTAMNLKGTSNTHTHTHSHTHTHTHACTCLLLHMCLIFFLP
jgi:hypothetical protein